MKIIIKPASGYSVNDLHEILSLIFKGIASADYNYYYYTEINNNNHLLWDIACSSRLENSMLKLLPNLKMVEEVVG
jgi:hypothetical protein